MQNSWPNEPKSLTLANAVLITGSSSNASQQVSSI